jgi:hypothetical protein
MENKLVRGFVMTLVLIGFGAFTVPSKSASAQEVSATTSFDGLPLCWPSDPTHCGMD